MQVAINVYDVAMDTGVLNNDLDVPVVENISDTASDYNRTSSPPPPHRRTYYSEEDYTRDEDPRDYYQSSPIHHNYDAEDHPRHLPRPPGGPYRSQPQPTQPSKPFEKVSLLFPFTSSHERICAFRLAAPLKKNKPFPPPFCLFPTLSLTVDPDLSFNVMNRNQSELQLDLLHHHHHQCMKMLHR